MTTSIHELSEEIFRDGKFQVVFNSFILDVRTGSLFDSPENCEKLSKYIDEAFVQCVKTIITENMCKEGAEKEKELEAIKLKEE